MAEIQRNTIARKKKGKMATYPNYTDQNVRYLEAVRNVRASLLEFIQALPKERGDLPILMIARDMAKGMERIMPKAAEEAANFGAMSFQPRPRWMAASFPRKVTRTDSVIAIPEEKEEQEADKGKWEAASPSRRGAPNHRMSATTFSPQEMKNAMIRSRGMSLPGSNPDEAMDIIVNVADGKMLHPKRFGDETLVQKTTSSSIIALTENNFQAGNSLVIFSPVLASHKGVLVAQLPGGDDLNTFEWVLSGPGKTLLAAITPDRNSEDLGTALNNLYAECSVSIPTVVGGTNVVTSQISLEQGIVQLNPLLVVPGKLSSIAKNRQAPIQLIGTESHTVRNFTALMPDNQVRRFNAYDPLNTNLSRSVPGTVTNAEMSSTIETSNNYSIACPYVPSGPANIGNGWSLAGGDPGIIPFWELAKQGDGLRHVLFGNFTLSLNMSAELDSNDTGTQTRVRMIVQYGDGIAVNADLVKVGTVKDQIFSQNMSCQFSTEGSGLFSGKEGTPIANISLQVLRTGNVDLVLLPNLVSIEFHDVPAVSPYLVTVVTGAQVGAQLNVGLIAHTEVRPDPSTKIAQYVSPTESLPYDPDYIRGVLLAMEVTQYPMAGNFEAGAFGEKLKKFFKGAWRAISPNLGAIANMYAPGSGEMVNQMVGNIGRNQAGSFAMGGGHQETGIYFPIANEKSQEVGTVQVLKGRGPGCVPRFTVLSPRPLHASNPAYVGESHDLAFALATLAGLGFDVQTGLFTGQVEDLRATPREFSMVIVPVRLTEMKTSAFQDLTAATPEGWSVGGKIRRTIIQTDLLKSGKGDFDVKEVQGENGPEYEVSYVRYR